MMSENPVHPFYAPIPEVRAKGIGRGRPSIEDRQIHPESTLAQELGIPRGALRNARRTGRLKFMNIGRKVYLSKRWIQEWVEFDAHHKQRHAQKLFLQHLQASSNNQK